MKEGTDVAISTNVSSNPPVSVGCGYIYAILIWIPLPCLPDI
jgi:hypothetical protein